MQRLLNHIWPTYLDPELSLTADQRKAIHRHAWRLWFRNPWNLLIYIIYLPLALLAMILTRDLLGYLAFLLDITGLAFKFARAAGLILGFLAAFVFAGAVLQRWRFAPCVYRAAREHGHNICPQCGYCLESLADDTTECPECGLPLAGSRHTRPH